MSLNISRQALSLVQTKIDPKYELNLLDSLGSPWYIRSQTCSVEPWVLVGEGCSKIPFIFEGFLAIQHTHFICYSGITKNAFLAQCMDLDIVFHNHEQVQHVK